MIHIGQLIGYVMMCFTTPERSYLIWPGLSLAMGFQRGYGLTYTNAITPFPKYRSFLMAGVIAGGYVGAFVYLGLQYAYGNYRIFWWVLTACLPICWIRTIFLTPKRKNTIDDRRVGWCTRNDPPLKVFVLLLFTRNFNN